MVMQLSLVFGQTNKKVEKAVKIFNSGKIDKAIPIMEKIVEKESSDDNWNTLINMYYYRYEYAKENATNAVVVAIGQSMGANMKHKDYTSSNKCFNDLILKCREASLYSQSTRASQLIRNYLVDYTPDTTISEEAKKEFETGEEYFGKKDYSNSKIHYQNALSIKPDYYKATIYLGDSYWYLNNMDSAIHYFRKGIEMNPDLLEPRKYLVDALGYSKKNEEAKKECIDAIYIYPDQSMLMKYSNLLEREDKKINKHWAKRGCEINSIGWTETKTKDPIWSIYQKAENRIKEYCDSNGVIVKSNTLTKAKYLEVYSWETMLNSSTELSNEMKFAREMADKGFLDCYIFISVFHYDLYGQYADFVKENKERIKTYIETYLIE
jgi:tetratricopeptide (TPR) repeat protein